MAIDLFKSLINCQQKQRPRHQFLTGSISDSPAFLRVARLSNEQRWRSVSTQYYHPLPIHTDHYSISTPLQFAILSAAVTQGVLQVGFGATAQRTLNRPPGSLTAFALPPVLLCPLKRGFLKSFCLRDDVVIAGFSCCAVLSIRCRCKSWGNWRREIRHRVRQATLEYITSAQSCA